MTALPVLTRLHEQSRLTRMSPSWIQESLYKRMWVLISPTRTQRGKRHASPSLIHPSAQFCPYLPQTAFPFTHKPRLQQCWEPVPLIHWRFFRVSLVAIRHLYTCNRGITDNCQMPLPSFSSSNFNFPLHFIQQYSTKMYDRNASIAPSVVNLHIRWRWVGSFHAPSLCIHGQAGAGSSQPIYTLWSRRKSPAPAGNLTPVSW